MRPLLLHVLLFFLLVAPPGTYSQRGSRSRGGLIDSTATNSVNDTTGSSSNTTTSSNDTTTSSNDTTVVTIDPDCVVWRVVSNTDEATLLGEDILDCPGASFEVEWMGHVRITQPLDVVAGTSLKITVHQG